MATLTTLIPAYKKQYLGELFTNLQQQYFKDFRVILSDDSPNGEITEMLRAGRFRSQIDELDITVVPGPKNARLNFLWLLEQWGGSTPLVHLHLDDDVILPDFYEQHVRAHASGEYSLSVSRRWYSRNDSRIVNGNAPPSFVADSPLRVTPIDAEQLFRHMVPYCDNFLGEFTNMVLSAETAKRYPRASATEMTYFGWPDVGLMLTAVQQAPLAFVNDHLSIWRQNAAQSTNNFKHHGGRVSSMAWAANALLAWKQGRITAPEAVQAITKSIRECLERFGEGDEVMNRFFELVQVHGSSLENLYAAFEAFWIPLLASHPATAPEGVFPAYRPALATEPAAAAFA
jgi:hypothetical protein